MILTTINGNRASGCFLFLLCCLLHLHPFAQNAPGFSEEIEFISHLQDNNEFKNSVYLGKKAETWNLNPDQKDSLNYYLGWATYNIKSLDTSAMYLSKVAPRSAFYNKSVFYLANNYAYLSKYDEALKASSAFTDTSLQQLSFLQKGAVYLLKRDYKSFDSISKLFDYSNFNVATEQKEMLMYENKLKKFKKKSPFVAGMLSAVVPGLGKLYAGKQGQSFAMAAACFITGLVAAENLYRGGPSSPQFIATTTIFGFFYLGNIWGSVLSVKMARQSFNNKTDNEIRVSIHLPLRRIFN